MKKTEKILFLFCVIFAVLSIFNIVNAASASISASKTSVNIGDNVTISVNINAATWNLKVSGSGISDSIVGYDEDANNVSKSKSYTLNTSSAGTYTVTLSGDVTDGVTDVNSPINQTVTVTVTQPEPPPVVTPDPEPDPVPNPDPVPIPNPDPTTKSSVAILSYLGIDKPDGYDFTGFKGNENKPDWKAPKIFPNEITRVYIDARPGANGKVISGGGWQNIKEGRQKLEVVVQSEDGKNKKYYYIEIEREVASAEPDTDENVADTTSDEIVVGLGKLEIAGMTLSPEFSTNEYKYTVEGIIDNIKTLSDFKELITAEANFEGASIEVTSDDEEFKVGRNKIIITVKDTDGREIAIYNIVLKLKSSDTAAGIIKDNEEDESKTKVDTNKIIVISAIAIVSIFAIVITTIAYKQRKLLEENGLVGREDDYEEFDWGEKQEDIKPETEEDKNKKLDEFFNQKSEEFEAEDKDFETKKSRGGKRFQ